MRYRTLLAPAALAGLLALGSGGCSETQLANAVAQIEVNPTSISFGEVSLLSIDNVALQVRNTGNGPLHVEGADIVDDPDWTFWVSGEPQSIASGDDWVLTVSFAPVDEVTQSAALRLTTNSETDAVLDVPLDGVGVRPILDVTPSALHFDTSDGAVASSKTVVLESTGSGTVVLTDVVLSDDTEGAFGVTLPASVTLPYELEPGLSIEIEVDHEPIVGASYGASLHVRSNDLNDEDQVVAITASGTGVGGTPCDPLISSPNTGFALQVGGTFDLTGTVTDEDQPADTLVAYVQSDLQGNLGTVLPDGDGNVSLTGIELEHGTHTVSLVCVDNEANLSTASISVLVWEEEETFDYTISGGETPYHYFMIDDDLTIYLNGAPIFIDDDGGQNLHAPVPLTATPGDTLRIVAEDQLACTKAIDALFLHLNEANIQPLNDAVCVSACDDNECYDAEYEEEAEWPNEFLDEQYVIAIP